MAELGEQTLVKLSQRSVCWFEGRADEVRRNALPATFELTLMEEPQPGRQVGDDGSRFVHAGRECGGCTRFVMILHEPRELALEVEPGVEMLPHRSRVTLAQSIV